MNMYSHDEPADTCDAVIVDPDAIARVRRSELAERSITRTAAIFSALSDPTRLRMLNALSVTELCVCDLAEIAGVSPSGASHQLRLLRDRGLVTYRKSGKRAVYRLADDHVHSMLLVGRAHAEEERS